MEAAAVRRKGIVYGLSAYIWWGFFPVYFKAVQAVRPVEMVAHRIIWSLLFLLLLIAGKRAWRSMLLLLVQPRLLLSLSATTLLIATNWLLFIYAVTAGEILQSSLGYFINPLVSVLLGFLFLKERLERPQWISVALAASGVLYLSIQHGKIPWISLILALSFGLYGLIRKSLPVEPLVGLTAETLLLAPFAFAYLVSLHHAGTGAFLAVHRSLDLLIMASGFITAIPLLMFAAAANRLRLATIGFLQYITPTTHFLLAVGIYGETFTTTHLVSFVLIWTGLALYSLHAYRSLRVRL